MYYQLGIRFSVIDILYQYNQRLTASRRWAALLRQGAVGFDVRDIYLSGADKPFVLGKLSDAYA